MAMTALEFDTLQAVFLICRMVLTDLEPRLAQLQHI